MGNGARLACNLFGLSRASTSSDCTAHCASVQKAAIDCACTPQVMTRRDGHSEREAGGHVGMGGAEVARGTEGPSVLNGAGGGRRGRAHIGAHATCAPCAPPQEDLPFYTIAHYYAAMVVGRGGGRGGPGGPGGRLTPWACGQPRCSPLLRLLLAGTAYPDASAPVPLRHGLPRPCTALPLPHPSPTPPAPRPPTSRRCL